MRGVVVVVVWGVADHVRTLVPDEVDEDGAQGSLEGTNDWNVSGMPAL